VAAEHPKLTVAVIVDAAIAVADRDGMGALSMRRIADELGVGAMSLYRHVAGKDTLIEEMTVEVGRRFPYPIDTEPALGWRERVAAATAVDWELYQHHPWVVQAYTSPRYGFSIESLRCLDWLVGGFMDGLGVDVEVATGMSLTVWSYVNGVALAALPGLTLDAVYDGPGGLADLIEGRVTDPPPHLAGLAGSARARELTDPRARIDRGIAWLCSGFAAG